MKVGKNKRKKNKAKKGNKLAADGENARKQIENDEVEDDSQHAESEDGTDDVKNSSNKRSHEDDNSDIEDKPQKKKKKKQPVHTDSSDKKNKKSIRQMKREKHAERQAEAQAASKDQLKSQCLNYLSQWKHNKQNWKFMKAKQVWLYKNKFSAYLLPDESWQLFLDYFESAKGNIRNMLLDDSNKIMKQMDEWMETQEKGQQADDEEQSKKEEVTKPSDVAYKRARDLIQLLN